MDHIGFTRCVVDTLVNQGLTLFYGFMINASVNGGDVSFYEGLDASSGRLIQNVQSMASHNNVFFLSTPLLLERGLFVDVGSNITSVTVLWSPMLREA